MNLNESETEKSGGIHGSRRSRESYIPRPTLQAYGKKEKRKKERKKEKEKKEALVAGDFPAEVLLSLESVVGWLVG